MFRASLFAVLTASSLAVATPSFLPLQGRLLDSSEQPVTGVRTMTFALYTVARDPGTTPVAPFWKGTYTDVLLSAGAFAVNLGVGTGVEPIKATDLDHEDIFLGVTIGTGGELSPRLALGATAYSLMARNAESAKTLDGLGKDAFAAAVHDHDGRYHPKEAFLADGTATVDWARLAHVPATATGYKAGAGLAVAANEFSVKFGTAEGTVAAGNHDHDAVYSQLGHNHDAAYAALGHNHDASYAALGHNHDASYLKTDARIPWAKLDNVPAGLADGDDVLSEAQVETYIKNGPLNMVGPLGVGVTSAVETLDLGGALRLGATNSTCDLAHRGGLQFIASGTGVADRLALCMKSGADTYSWTEITSVNPFPGSLLVTNVQGGQINTWVGNSSQIWTLCYRRSRDGTSTSTFHNNCNNKGVSVTIARLSTGVLIGGYAAAPWNSNNTYVSAPGSFLFSLTNNFKYTAPGQNNSSSRIYCDGSYGPTWGGGHDWSTGYNSQVGSGSGDSYCNLGYDYACRVGSYSTSTCQNDFCGQYASWTISELEVWVRP